MNRNPSSELVLSSKYPSWAEIAEQETLWKTIKK